MGKLKLMVNEEKTRICKVPDEEFDFLGYTFGRMYSARTGQARLGYRPSKKSIKHAVDNIHALTARSGTWQETTEMVQKLNRTLRGWANYFEHQSVPGDRQLHRYAVAPVVAHQAQEASSRHRVRRRSHLPRSDGSTPPNSDLLGRSWGWTCLMFIVFLTFISMPARAMTVLHFLVKADSPENAATIADKIPSLPMTNCKPDS